MYESCEPTLLLNERICKSNIQKMADKVQKFDLSFKPHMKTHQSADIGNWYKEVGVEAITVSSVKMAQYFAENGWNDITIAFPANIKQVKQIDDLTSRIKLTLLLSNAFVAGVLDKELTHDANVYIELDTGGNRSGLKVTKISKIKGLIEQINNSKHLHWSGFYSHPGHSYQAHSKQEILKIHRSVQDQLKDLKTHLGLNQGSFEICIGDTPCCSVGTSFENIDAISPGNFVFYDYMQYQIGSCDIKDIAVAMECPIVDRYEDRKELVIYGGAIHFSKESNSGENPHYGPAVIEKNGSWQVIDSDTYLKSISQEHGIIRCSPESFEEFKIGQSITILPIHSCLTANLMKNYQLTDGRKIFQLS